MSNPETKPEVTELYRKYGVMNYLTKARPLFQNSGNIYIQDGQVAAGSGFKGVLIRNKSNRRQQIRKNNSKNSCYFSKNSLKATI